jgi:hypothetical protein
MKQIPRNTRQRVSYQPIETNILEILQSWLSCTCVGECDRKGAIDEHASTVWYLRLDLQALRGKNGLNRRSVGNFTICVPYRDFCVDGALNCDFGECHGSRSQRGGKNIRFTLTSNIRNACARWRIRCSWTNIILEETINV